MMDQEMLLVLRKLEQKGVEFTAMLQKAGIVEHVYYGDSLTRNICR